ncbi:MAG: hypothetical protein IPI67_17835 [Myxococcales bacterium]|nr:hypothetical protein [Myxococcales bacterium]
MVRRQRFSLERAQTHGIRTLAGHAHGYFLPKYGLNQGWDDYRLLDGTALETAGCNRRQQRPLERAGEEFVVGPGERGSSTVKALFAYVHFVDPHFTYVKHPEDPDYGDKRRDLYDNEFTSPTVGSVT